MKTLKFIIPFMIIICLCGCGNTVTSSEPAIVINMPTDNTVNGYRIPASQSNADSAPQSNTSSQSSYSASVSSAASGNTASTYYCASISGSKFHIPTCGSAKNIKDENLVTSPDRQFFIDDGYEPCSRCNP